MGCVSVSTGNLGGAGDALRRETSHSLWSAADLPRLPANVVCCRESLAACACPYAFCPSVISTRGR